MTTSYEVVDDKRFRISYFTRSSREKGQSETIRHGGLEWMLDVKEKFGTLSCGSRGREQWSVDAKVMFRIVDFDCSPALVEDMKTFRVVLDNNNHNVVWESIFFDYFDFTKLVCVVEIVQTAGLPGRRDFTIYDNKFSDMILIVDGNELYVNKGILASVSPVFYSMFYTNFKEADAEQVVLNDVDYHDFLVILRVLHDKLPLITEYNIDDILKLADQFDIKIIMDECQQFIIITDSMPLANKIRLADKYQMKDVITCLIESEGFILGAVPVDDISCDTVKQLMNKQMMLKNKYINTMHVN